MVRYADDFIITGKTKELLEEEVKVVVSNFLKERGLVLSQTKTQVTHIEDGFDFLGKHIRKYDGKLLIKPSKKNVKAFLTKVKAVIEGNLHISVDKLLLLINPMIRGWANNHCYCVSKRIFNYVDKRIFYFIKKWIDRRHPKKSGDWKKKKYFQQINTRNWVFQSTFNDNSGEPQIIRLFKAADVGIRRHIKIKSAANPYDPEWETYFEERIGLQMKENLKGRRVLLRIWFQQDGLCLVCSQKITKDTGWNIHHIERRVDGGKSIITNLVLLHSNCHKQAHSEG